MELVEYLLPIKGVLSNRLCQDPLESFFSESRGCGEGTVIILVLAPSSRELFLYEFKAQWLVSPNMATVVDHTPLPKRRKVRAKNSHVGIKDLSFLLSSYMQHCQ